MAKYENIKYDNWTLEHTRKERFELKGRIVELPEEIGDKYPNLLKKIEEEKVVTNDNKIEQEKDEIVAMNIEEPVKEKKTRKKLKTVL